MGYLYSVIAAVAFAVLGISYKLADRMDCDKRQVNLFMYLAAAAMALVWAMVSWTRTSHGAVGLGVLLGILAFGSVAVFRYAVARGPISTSWTILNLALVLPVFASIVIWHEMPSPRHYLGFGLAVAAIVLLGYDLGEKKP